MISRQEWYHLRLWKDCFLVLVSHLLFGSRKRIFYPVYVEYISRDESLHVAHAAMLYGKLQNNLSNKDFMEIMKEVVDIEIEFITLAVPCRMIGMNATLMISYIKFVADRSCLQLGYDKIYGDKNPLDFIESISLDFKTNMFEARISDYGLADKTKTEDVFDY